MVNINIAKPFSNYNLKVYNNNGILMYEDIKIAQPTYSFDMNGFANGTYTIVCEINDQIVFKKLILAK